VFKRLLIVQVLFGFPSCCAPLPFLVRRRCAVEMLDYCTPANGKHDPRMSTPEAVILTCAAVSAVLKHVAGLEIVPSLLFLGFGVFILTCLIARLIVKDILPVLIESSFFVGVTTHAPTWTDIGAFLCRAGGETLHFVMARTRTSSVRILYRFFTGFVRVLSPVALLLNGMSVLLLWTVVPYTTIRLLCFCAVLAFTFKHTLSQMNRRHVPQIVQTVGCHLHLYDDPHVAQAVDTNRRRCIIL